MRVGKPTALDTGKLSAPGRYGDGGNPYLHIKPSGARARSFRFTPPGRKPCEMSLGNEIDVSLSEARDRAHSAHKLLHPWTNGHAERTNRIVETRVLTFVSAYNFAKHLKALRWKTVVEVLCHGWTTTPDIFKLNPRHLIPGLYA